MPPMVQPSPWVKVKPCRDLPSPTPQTTGTPPRLCLRDGAIQHGHQRSNDAALTASRSLSSITVAPALTGRGAVGPQLAAATANRWTVGAAAFVGGVGSTMWGMVLTTIRQQAVPRRSSTGSRASFGCSALEPEPSARCSPGSRPSGRAAGGVRPHRPVQHPAAGPFFAVITNQAFADPDQWLLVQTTKAELRSAQANAARRRAAGRPGTRPTRPRGESSVGCDLESLAPVQPVALWDQTAFSSVPAAGVRW